MKTSTRTLEIIKKAAKHNLESAGQLAPLMIISDKDKKKEPAFVHITDFPEDSGKKGMQMAYIGAEIYENMKNIEEVIMVFDTWYSKDRTSRPSQAKDRVEAVMITASTRKSGKIKNTTTLLPYDRKGQEIVWKKEKQNKMDVTSPLITMFWGGYDLATEGLDVRELNNLI